MRKFFLVEYTYFISAYTHKYIYQYTTAYTIARNKAKISENTSDLSTTELPEATKNLYHAKNIRRKKLIEKKRKIYLIWNCGVQRPVMIQVIFNKS